MAAAGKKESVSSSLRSLWRKVCGWEMEKEQRMARMKQIFGANVEQEPPCASVSRHRVAIVAHLVFFEGKVAVDVRLRIEREVDAFDTSKDGQWENWAAKHEDEEMKAGVWMEPVQAVLRRKTTEAWTEKHQHVTKKLFVEGGWVQKRFFDTCWSDEKKCRGCNHEEGTGKHRLYHCPSWREVRRNLIPEGLEKGIEGHSPEERLEVAKRNHDAPFE